MDDEIRRCKSCGAWTIWPYYCGRCGKIEHGWCKFCGRPMRRRTWDKIPGFVTYGGRGYCMSHYLTVNKYGEEELERALDEAVESYWRNRTFVLAGKGNDANNR